MDFILDNSAAENKFRQILRSIPAMQNGVTAESMQTRGIRYEKNWGVSIVDLKNLASTIEKDHLLALKLWNKKWRETMILATMLDVPKDVTEEQMDFWVRTAENTDIVEQMVSNLFTATPYAFIKALEWCRGKKFLVKYAGLLMMGRLALTSENDIDEMFEPFFEILTPLAKDEMLYNVFYRSYCQLARRSHTLHLLCVQFAEKLVTMEEDNAKQLGNEALSEINSEEFLFLIKNNT